MNKRQLEQELCRQAAEVPVVSADLHGQIMRAVSRVETKSPARWHFSLTPALAVGAMATLAAVLVWSDIATTTVVDSTAGTVAAESNTGIKTINQQLVTLGSEVRLPEAALRQELQRLEADLKRFRLRS